MADTIDSPAMSRLPFAAITLVFGLATAAPVAAQGNPTVLVNGAAREKALLQRATRK